MIKRKLETAKEKGEPIPEAEEAKLWEEAHEWGAERLANTIGDLKGFYVKSGQVISTRVDMFPKQYTDKLQSLQDAVDPIPASVVKAVVRQDLLEGEPLEVMFKEFDDKPLGSASIAQVRKISCLELFERTSRLLLEHEPHATSMHITTLGSPRRAGGRAAGGRQGAATVGGAQAAGRHRQPQGLLQALPRLAARRLLQGNCFLV
jgi:hypothetical protein